MRERAFAVVLVTAILLVGAFLGSAVSQWLNRPEEPATGSIEIVGQGPDPALGRIRVEVLNAGGRDGMARRATAVLRERGVDVVFVGNAGRSDAARSEVVARGTSDDDARVVAGLLGIEAVRSAPDSTLLLEVTVHLGADWTPGMAPPPSADRRGWWERLVDPAGDGDTSSADSVGEGR